MADPSNIKVGEIYDGKILKIKPFGVIVSLPNSIPGLVHISQITNGFIENIEDILSIGEEVVVRAVSVDAEAGKISLTMKDVPQPNQLDDDDEDFYNASYGSDTPVVITPAQAIAFEEKLKSWQKLSSDRIAGVNRRNKRKK